MIPARCSLDDFEAIDRAIPGGLPHTSAPVSQGCRSEDLMANDVPEAHHIVLGPTGGVLNAVQLHVGLGVTL